MPLSNMPDDLEHPHDAAHWFARMQSGEATEQDRQAFEAWRNADPEHDRQYRQLSYLWQATLTLPESRLRSMMAEHALPGAPEHALGRRRVGLWLAGGCALAAVGGAALLTGGTRAPLQTMTLMTQKGQRQQVLLPDGSTLLLNTNTLAVMQFYENQRQITLQHGEAYFQVSTDVDRPFVVDAGLGRITVTGTRFNVRRDPQALQVSVVSGSVRVQTGPWWGRSVRQLTAGQQTNAHPDAGLEPIHSANVDNLLAWTRGKVIFNDAPLGYVIEEMNRYLDRPARLQAPALAQHHVSGVFNVDDPQAMINALPAIAPVRLARNPDGGVSILPR